MIEDELIKIWQTSSNQERIKFEKSKLMIELQSSLKRLDRWWNYIELSETILAVFGVLLSTFLLFKIPFILTKIALALMIICAVYLIIKYRGIKKFQPSDLENNYLNYLKKNREYLHAQKKFLKTYFYWGILPVYPIMLLFTISVWEKVPVHLIVIINVATIGMGIYGYFLNKKRIKREITPRIGRVNELISEIEE
ncbi:hypothetical protein [Flagellimonas meridianipacifica]|uniref:Uncharacterized protein n=1 Tax=Flagellimonas meridianipacifica TaxID=1080225 RepID=A0A2T0M8Y6_9FLAO|nr:hypothetical protein [Allomuricauda pacifica]PRX53964.1 hypothetical protein CLV81_2357 [Allomuricauda pacifica]